MSCSRALRDEKCEKVVVLDEDYCGNCKEREGCYCFPVEDFSIHPFTNVVAATAAVVDLSNENVCVCDAGGCGRSGTVAASALAYLNRELSFPSLKRMLRNEYGLLKECPEKLEQEEAIKIFWASFHYLGIEGFREMVRTSYVYLGRPDPDEVAGAFAVNVSSYISKKSKFIIIRKLTKFNMRGKEVVLKANVNELKKIKGTASKVVLEEFEKVPKSGYIVELEELSAEEVEPHAMAFATLEGLAFKTIAVEKALVLIAKSSLRREVKAWG